MADDEQTEPRDGRTCGVDPAEAAAARVRDLLAQHVPLALLVDLAADEPVSAAQERVGAAVPQQPVARRRGA